MVRELRGGHRRVAFGLLALVTATACARSFRPLPPARSAIPSSDPDDAIEQVNASDGIDKAEAHTIAAAYFLRFISGCGGPGVVARHGHEWWSTPTFGIGGRELAAPIKIDARTGGVSFDARAAGLSESDGRTFESIDDFRRFPVRVVLPFDTRDAWSRARMQQVFEVVDVSLREHHFGEARKIELDREVMLFEVFYVKSALPLLKNKLIELGAPASTVLEVDDGRYRMTLESIH